MKTPFQDRAKEIWDLITQDEFLRREIGDRPEVEPALVRMAMVLGDKQVDYAWAAVDSSEFQSEAGTLYALGGGILVSSLYGRTAKHDVRIEPLQLESISLDVRRTEADERRPDGVYEATARLIRAHQLPPLEIKAQALVRGDSVHALIALTRKLSEQFC